MDLVLGTAGHIDHGKTSLVRALTGINCDRLEEERLRGITIELGFAWLDLPDGRRMGIVDVPGHERFVKTMVAGAAGIDCVLLVIAADEGVMPQTREHLDICQFLGVRSGLIVLTKTDLVEPDLLEMAREDARAAVSGTFLAESPILDVSSATGQGIDNLKESIFRMASQVRASQGTDIFRLPVDRVFTLKGHGTVVTGTLISGTCGQGEEVCLMPNNLPARARSLQSHGQRIETGHRGMRCAMNLQGIEVAAIQRGDVVAAPDTLFPSRRWMVRLTCLASAPHGLHQRMEAHFHHGSRECAARIVFRDRDELAPGDSAIAEVHFPTPMAGIFGDHCVLRAHAPLRTVAGGILLDPLPSLLRKRDPRFSQKMAVYQELDSLASAESANPKAIVERILFLQAAPGLDNRRLAVRSGLPAALLAKGVEAAEKTGAIIRWDNENHIGKEAFEACIEKCVARARELHAREPLKPSFAANALLVGWAEAFPTRFSQKVLAEAVQRGLLQTSGIGFKLASHTVSHDAEQSALLQKLRDLLMRGGVAPPFLKEIEELAGPDIKKTRRLINYLCDIGEVIKIQDGVYYHKPALEKIVSQAREWLVSNASLDIAGMRDLFGVSRKYAVPLLEYMDSIRMTRRVGNIRQLVKKADT